MNNAVCARARKPRGNTFASWFATVATAGVVSGCVSAPPPPAPKPMDFGSLQIERVVLAAGPDEFAPVERDPAGAAGEGAKDGAAAGAGGMLTEACPALLLAGPIGLPICGLLVGAGAVAGAGAGVVIGALEEGTSDDPDDIAMIQARLEELSAEPEPALREGFLSAAQASKDTVDDRLVAPMGTTEPGPPAHTLIRLEINQVGFYRAPGGDRNIGIQLDTTARFIDGFTGDEVLVLTSVLQGRTHLLISWTGNEAEMVNKEFAALMGQLAGDLLAKTAGMQAAADNLGSTGEAVASVATP